MNVSLSTYESSRPHELQLVAEKFLQDARVLDGEDVLHVGCLYGRETHEVVLPRCKPGARLVGADIQPALLDYGRKHFGHSGHIHFVDLDILDKLAPEHQQAYDHVLCLDAPLSSTRHLDRALVNIRTALKSGGSAFIHFVASSPHLDAFRELAASDRWSAYLYKEDLEEYTPLSHDWANPKKEITDLARTLDFSVDLLEVTNWHIPFRSMDHFRKYFNCVATMRLYLSLPPSCREEFWDDFCSLAISYGVMEAVDGSIYWPVRTLSAVFRKPHYL